MPRKKNKEKDPNTECPCKCLIRKTAWIECTDCCQWWHAGCVSLTKEICEIFRKKKLKYSCPNCTIYKLKVKEQECESDQEESNLKCTDAESEVLIGGNDSPVLVVNDQPSNINDNFSTSDNKVCAKENRVILDGLKDPKLFRNSRDIKKQIRESKNIDVDFAYSLPRGGIVVETKSKEQAEVLKEQWPEEAFNNSGTVITGHSESSSCPQPRCVLKNVPVCLDDKVISLSVKEQTGANVTTRRLRYTDTNKPLKIVILTGGSFLDIEAVFKSELILGKARIVITPYRNKGRTPIRCYKCQYFGHIAALCSGEARCVRCSGVHGDVCKEQLKCANCGGPHAASFSRCPAFIKVRERLAARV